MFTARIIWLSSRSSQLAEGGALIHPAVKGLLAFRLANEPSELISGHSRKHEINLRTFP